MTGREVRVAPDHLVTRQPPISWRTESGVSACICQLAHVWRSSWNRKPGRLPCCRPFATPSHDVLDRLALVAEYVLACLPFHR